VLVGCVWRRVSETSSLGYVVGNSRTCRPSERRISTRLLVAACLAIGVTSSANAQQSEPPDQLVERIRAALQSSQQPITGAGLSVVAPNAPKTFRLGVLTFAPPDTPGQFVSIRVPVGALASRAAESVVAVRHRRAENAALAEVTRALIAFQQAQWKSATAAR
jgi:hypothetical protein